MKKIFEDTFIALMLKINLNLPRLMQVLFFMVNDPLCSPDSYFGLLLLLLRCFIFYLQIKFSEK